MTPQPSRWGTPDLVAHAGCPPGRVATLSPFPPPRRGNRWQNQALPFNCETGTAPPHLPGPVPLAVCCAGSCGVVCGCHGVAVGWCRPNHLLGSLLEGSTPNPLCTRGWFLTTDSHAVLCPAFRAHLVTAIVSSGQWRFKALEGTSQDATKQQTRSLLAAYSVPKFF